jgi:7-carboxy-7-deazaguanine synthase
MNGATYPLARQGVFRTVQGEGALLGIPMVFVRLAGCSVGCAECETDYRAVERASAAEITLRGIAVRGNASWVWVTGGEPADHDLSELLDALRCCGRVALATSGGISGCGGGFVDFLSVSPHGPPSKLLLTTGNQINLVPGLGGLDLRDWKYFTADGFTHRYVTPLWYTPGERAERVDECVLWLADRPDWKLGVQAHRLWALP